MKLEYEGVLARPGYNEKYKKDVSWEELKNSALMYRRLPLIVAGTVPEGAHRGPIDPNLASGFVDQKIDEQNKVINGRYVIFPHKADALPDSFKQLLLTNGHVKASLGYEPFDQLRKYDHVLIGAETPVFEDIGFHAEEDDSFRYEETEGINKEEAPTEDKPPSDDVSKLRAEIAEMKQLFIEAMKPKEPEVVPSTKEQEPRTEAPTEAPPAEEAIVPPPKPKVEPERTFPREIAPSDVTHDGLFLKGGTRIITTEVGKKLVEPNKEK